MQIRQEECNICARFVEWQWIIMVSEFFPKNVTFTKLYYFFFHFFQSAEKVRGAVSRTP